MRASRELELLHEKLADGRLHPDEPLFVLRGRDILAPDAIRAWCRLAGEAGVPVEKISEAFGLAHIMELWPQRRIPGLPETEMRHEHVPSLRMTLPIDVGDFDT